MGDVLKKLLHVTLPVLSPFALLLPIGAIYVVFQLINGVGLLAGVSSLIALLCF